MARTSEYFVGKTVIITGAASGIGRAAALIFAREGANVVCADIDAEGAERVAALVKQRGAGALAIATDVTSRQSVKDMIKAAIARFGLIDFEINSAGAAGRRSPFLEIDDELWDKTFALNASGVFYGMQEILPHMVDNGCGVIVNLASVAHKRGGAGVSVHYAAAKGAVATLTVGVAKEFVGAGVRVLAIAPGPVATSFQKTAGTSDELMDEMKARVPMGRFGEPEEIGELALFMCSDACPFMTGETVYVDGGAG